MIKKVTPFLFVLFYTLSIVGSTIERTQAWAAERTHDSKRGGGQHPARISEWHRRPVRQMWQTKILEDGSVLVSPFVQTNPPHCETALLHFSLGFAPGQSAQASSSRAPPIAVA
jgi:hypothetical protein